MLASTVRHQRACCYPATLWAASHQSSLTWATQFYRLWDILCMCLLCWIMLKYTQRMKELWWNCFARQVFFAVCVWHLIDWCQAIWHRYCSYNLPVKTSVYVLMCIYFLTCCVHHVFCVAVQGVNGHFRKVTVWGRKDSIVYRHSPCSWRWTTMVSFIYFRLFISIHSVDIHSTVLFFYKVKHYSPGLALCVLFCTKLGVSIRLISFILLLLPKATSFGICIGSSWGKKKIFIFVCIFLETKNEQYVWRVYSLHSLLVLVFHRASHHPLIQCIICYSVHRWKCSPTTSQKKKFIRREEEFVSEALWAVHRGMWERARVKGVYYVTLSYNYVIIGMH